MQYLIKYSLARNFYEYYVVDQADDLDHMWDQFFDSFGEDFDLDVLWVDAVYELKLVERPGALQRPAMDTSCQDCGLPDHWPLCYDCERARDYHGGNL